MARIYICDQCLHVINGENVYNSRLSEVSMDLCFKCNFNRKKEKNEKSVIIMLDQDDLIRLTDRHKEDSKKYEKNRDERFALLKARREARKNEKKENV